MLDLLLPPVCFSCRRLLRRHSELGLCSTCAPDLVPAPGSSAAPLCYEGPARKALGALKYDRDLAVAGPLGRLLSEAHQLHDPSIDAWIPVPLHARRLRRRGFNQAALLLREARAHLPRERRKPLWPILARTRATTPQVGLSAQARRRNVDGAFAVKPRLRSDLRGRHVLLVDDVVTTGATAAACAKPLREAGATVSILALMQAVA